jgi:TnpA family transposase
VARSLDLNEFIEHWTLLDDERERIAGKRGPTRLGFALLLKFYTRLGRFPRGRGELPDEAVDFVARQVGVQSTELGLYKWTGRTMEYHRAQIRAYLGFRECSVADADKLTQWLAASACAAERRPELVRDELLVRCRAERIEPPVAGRIDRIVRSALHQAEQTLTLRVVHRLPADVAGRLRALVAVERADEDAEAESVLTLIKSAPGNVGLNSMLTEIRKLRAVRAVGLPAELFAGVAPRAIAAWRTRATVESPSHLRDHPEPLMLVLLATLLHTRLQEITDTLVDLLISTVHRIGARADKKVTEELVDAFKRVTGKENILFAIAEASLAAPDDPIREVIYPAVSGGEQTLRDLVHEFKTKGPVYRRTLQTTLKASYSNHYRRGLIELLDVLEFRSNNATHRPVLDALDLIKRHADARLTYYPAAETVPTHKGLLGDWTPLVFAEGGKGGRIVRSVYEICTFQALRERLRCKEVWVIGADRWRNPDEDLPADFEANRVAHYAALRKPLDSALFIDQLRDEMRTELAALDAALPKLSWLEIADRGKKGPIKLTHLDALPEPPNLRRLKSEVRTRWGTVPLIDMLKEAVLRTGCLSGVTASAGRGDLAPDVLAERLLLAIYAYGTNTGIRAIAGNATHGHGEDDLRYVRRRYLTAEVARAIAVEIANATFAARAQTLWGAGSTAVASDSTHFGAFDQNIFTEWHSRYGGRGVLIYWHVERKSMAIHSQLINCSASEVAAMIEGAMRHGTTIEVEGNYVDSHGQSEVGFGITRLLGFDLLPRIKRINKIRLYQPAAGEPAAYGRLAPALTRPIRWEIIAEQYDQMIKYATAIRAGTASTEAILRRFTRANAIHPAYQAMIEVGRAQRTIFVARYLRDRDLQREINEGLNVVESWNRANSVIFFGKGGDIATNRRDEQELSVLCLRLLQAALVYVNTLMVQDVLAEKEWATVLTEADRRGLTPLFWTHIAPYGEIRLDMNNRLALGGSASTA